MKTKTVFVMLLVLLTCSCFAQKGDTTTKLNNYLNMLEKYKKYNFEELCNVIQKIDDNTLRREMKIIYDAIEIAPIEVHKILDEDNLRAENIYKKMKKNKLPIETLVEMGKIQNQLFTEIKKDLVIIYVT